MRTDEVIEEVSVLCGQGVYDDRKKLLHCLSKAAREIGLGRPLPGRMKIRHYPPGTIYSIYGRITVLPDAPFSIGGSGVSAYCFEADGALKVRVLQDGELCESMEFSDADGRFVVKTVEKIFFWINKYFGFKRRKMRADVKVNLHKKIKL